MNINNPTTFAAPDLTLSTSNSSGTSGALRADDTLAVFDATVPVTIASGASAATGSASVTARRDHTHGAPAIGDVVGPGSSVDNEVVRYNSTTGKLVQAYTSGGPTISDEGIMVKSGQPAFLAFMTGDALNSTGDGTVYTVAANSAVINVGSHYNTSNFTFTAPVAGSYQFDAHLVMSGITGSASGVNARLQSSRRTYLWSADPNGAAEVAPQISQLVDMDAEDVIIFTIQGNGESSDVMDVGGSGTILQTAWSGYLAL